MEEAVGDCTNLHIAYPPLVCARPLIDNDVAIDSEGRPVEAVRRFHAALRELADRRGIRNDASRYETISLALASTQPERYEPRTASE